MANITITVQSLLNAAEYDSYTIDNGQTINQLKTAIYNATGVETTWFDIVLNEQIATGTSTLTSLGIITGTRLRTHNKISRLATLELRQKSKLDLSALDRLASSNDRSTYDISELPTQYVGNTIYDNPNTGGLIEGRPWIETTTPFTFYEAFGTTSALTTTQYVSGNKIYGYASTLDVTGYQNSRVVVNDIEVLNIGDRGHNMVVLNSYGDLISTANYDTYDVPGDLTLLANALNAVASGNIVVLTVWDASALNATVRTAINNGYGSTNSNTWTAGRISQLFIGVKI
jgi:hypothetical protein